MILEAEKILQGAAYDEPETRESSCGVQRPESKRGHSTDPSLVTKASERRQGGQQEIGVPALLSPGREGVNLPLPLCSVQAFKRWRGTHPHWGGQSASLSPSPDAHVVLRHLACTQK